MCSNIPDLCVPESHRRAAQYPGFPFTTCESVTHLERYYFGFIDSAATDWGKEGGSGLASAFNGKFTYWQDLQVRNINSHKNVFKENCIREDYKHTQKNRLRVYALSMGKGRNLY